MSKKAELKKAADQRVKDFKAKKSAPALEKVRDEARKVDPAGAAAEKSSAKAAKQAQREAAKAQKAAAKSAKEKELQRYRDKVLELGGKTIEVPAHDETRPDGSVQHHKKYSMVSHSKESLAEFGRLGLPLYPKQWLAHYAK